jgi:hypothetical protein
MTVDDFAGRVFAATAAACDRQIGLHFMERACAAVQDLADLAVADGAADTNVHLKHP